MSRSARGPEPLRAARLSLIYLRLAVMNEVQYRFNFFIQLFQSLLALGTALVVLALVFGHTSDLNGWSRPELLAVVGVFTLMGGLIQSAIQPNMVRLMEDVRQGTLDHALTKPQDAQLMVSVRDFRIWQSVDVLIGLVILVIALDELRTGPSFWEGLGFVAALVMGGILIYSFWLMLTIAAFWVVRMDQIVDLFEGIYQAGRWPVSIYPAWLRIGLTFLVPIAFAVTLPAEGLTSRLAGRAVAGEAGLTLAVFTVARLLWKRGLRRYSGASA